jgi:hypothetical protein
LIEMITGARARAAGFRSKVRRKPKIQCGCLYEVISIILGLYKINHKGKALEVINYIPTRK